MVPRRAVQEHPSMILFYEKVTEKKVRKKVDIKRIIVWGALKATSNDTVYQGTSWGAAEAGTQSPKNKKPTNQKKTLITRVYGGGCRGGEEVRLFKAVVFLVRYNRSSP